MNISYYDFKNLSNQSQQDIVMSQGHMMTEFIKNDLKFVLYEISSFSVEIVYTNSNNRIAALNIYQNKSAYAN